MKNCDQLDAWLNIETIPIPIIQYQGEENELIRWQKALEQKVQENFSWFSYELLEDFYGITTNNLAIFGNGILPFEKNAWQTLLKEQVKDKFNALEDKIMPKKVLWFYSGQISTLQIGIGALFGFKRAACIAMEFSILLTRSLYFMRKKMPTMKNVSFKKRGFSVHPKRTANK